MLKGKDFMNMKNSKSLAVVVAFASLLSGCQSAGTAKSNGNQASAEQASATQASASNTNSAPANAAAPISNTTVPLADNAPASTVSNGNAPSNTPKVSKVSNAKAAPILAPQIGSGGNDLLLFTQTRYAIDSDGDLKRANIIIDIKNSVVTLNGTVANDAQKARAEQLIRGVNGVNSVKNQLKLSAKSANPTS
jgi:osmotically-inducible protein OsmY